MRRLMILIAAAYCYAPPVWAATPAAGEDTVLITWRDLRLNKGDYEAVVNAIPEIDRFAFQLSERRIRELLNTLLLNRTLAADARQRGLDKNPLIQREMALAAERVLAGRRLEAFEKSLKIPDMSAVAEERYRVRQQDYKVPEQVRASHVLVATKTRGDEEARARAEEVRRKALAGADFAGLAREFSDDASAGSNQGNLGFFARGRMAKAFEEAAFALEKPGDISPVIKTEFGYHVILLHEKQPARQIPFAEIKNQVIEQATKDYVRAQKERYVESIVTDKSIVIDTVAVGKLQKKMPKAPGKMETPIAKDPAGTVLGK